MTDELKPCPFCGGKAIMKVQNHIPNGYDYTPTCQNPSCAGRLTKKWTNKAVAIEAWNQRAMGATDTNVGNEIIYCKDCKYSHMTIDGLCKYCDIWFPEEEMYADGKHFCASAEKRML